MKINADKCTYNRNLQQYHPHQYAMGPPPQGQPPTITLHQPPMQPAHPIIPLQQFQAMSMNPQPQEEHASNGQFVVNNNGVHLVKNACIVKHVQYKHSNQKYFQGDNHNIPDEAILVAKLSDVHVQTPSSKTNPVPHDNHQEQNGTHSNGSATPNDEAFVSDVSEDGDHGQVKSQHMSSSPDSGCGMSDTSSGDNLDSSFSGEEDGHDVTHSNHSTIINPSYHSEHTAQSPSTLHVHNNTQNHAYTQVVHNNNVNIYRQTVHCHYGHETRPNNGFMAITQPVFYNNDSQTSQHYVGNPADASEPKPLCELKPIPQRFRQMLDEEARSNPVLYAGRFEGQAIIRHKPLGNRKRKLARLAEMARLMDQSYPHMFEFNPDAQEFEPQAYHSDAECSSEEESHSSFAEETNTEDSLAPNTVSKDTDSPVQLTHNESEKESSQTAECPGESQTIAPSLECVKHPESACVVKHSSVASSVDSVVDNVPDSDSGNRSNTIASSPVHTLYESVITSENRTINSAAVQAIPPVSPVAPVRYVNYRNSESAAICYANPQFSVPPPTVSCVNGNNNQMFVPTPCGYAPMYVNAVPSCHTPGCAPPVMQQVGAQVTMAPMMPAPQMPPAPMGTVYYPVYAPPPMLQAPVQPYPAVQYQQY